MILKSIINIWKVFDTLLKNSSFQAPSREIRTKTTDVRSITKAMGDSFDCEGVFLFFTEAFEAQSTLDFGVLIKTLKIRNERVDIQPSVPTRYSCERTLLL
jgi:hypothetical protein